MFDVLLAYFESECFLPQSQTAKGLVLCQGCLGLSLSHHPREPLGVKAGVEVTAWPAVRGCPWMACRVPCNKKRPAKGGG